MARWWKEQDGAEKMKPPPKNLSAVVDKSNKSKTQILSLTGIHQSTRQQERSKQMEEETNDKKAQRGEVVIKAYDLLMDQFGEVDETLISDALADVMHYCKANEIDIEGAVERAFIHFHEEVREEEQDKQRGDDS